MAFYCKYCGEKYDNIKPMLNHSCAKSPTKKHVVYEGNYTDPFICKHCGQEYSNIKLLLNHSCAKSPTKKHEPL